jgi:hypothetical protein
MFAAAAAGRTLEDRVSPVFTPYERLRRVQREHSGWFNDEIVSLSGADLLI